MSSDHDIGHFGTFDGAKMKSIVLVARRRTLSTSPTPASNTRMTAGV